jgi:hypothetical protein
VVDKGRALHEGSIGCSNVRYGMTHFGLWWHTIKYTYADITDMRLGSSLYGCDCDYTKFCTHLVAESW